MQVLNQKAASSLEKVSWNDVAQMGEQVSKQATVGILQYSSLSIFTFVYPIECLSCIWDFPLKILAISMNNSILCYAMPCFFFFVFLKV